MYASMHFGIIDIKANVCHCSDYKDDGTNILLDANENAYGPGLALSDDGKLANGDAASVEVDLLGLNRYPDPYDRSVDSPLAYRD